MSIYSTSRVLVGFFTVTVAVVLYLCLRSDILIHWDSDRDVAIRTGSESTSDSERGIDWASGIHEGCVQEYVTINEEWDIFRETLIRYRNFHSAQLTLLLSQPSAPVRTLIWACEGVCSGLGARMRSLEASFLMAVLTDRVFGIYIGDINKPSMQYLEPNEIDWSLVYDTKQGMHKEADYIRDLRSKECDLSLFSLLVSNKSHLTFTLGMERPFEKCRSKHRDKFDEIGLKFGYDKSILFGIVHHYLFKYSPQLLTRTQEAMQSLGLQDKTYVALHMRTGFEGMDIQESPDGFGNSGKILHDRKQWKESMDCALGVADDKIGKNSPIFLATDSYDAKEWAAAQYGDRVRTVTNVTIVHVDKRESWTKEDDQFLGTWIDIVLLARAYVVVRSGSGFSVFASQLCMMPSHRIYNIRSCK